MHHAAVMTWVTEHRTNHSQTFFLVWFRPSGWLLWIAHGSISCPFKTFTCILLSMSDSHCLSLLLCQYLFTLLVIFVLPSALCLSQHRPRLSFSIRSQLAWSKQSEWQASSSTMPDKHLVSRKSVARQRWVPVLRMSPSPATLFNHSSFSTMIWAAVSCRHNWKTPGAWS